LHFPATSLNKTKTSRQLEKRNDSRSGYRNRNNSDQQISQEWRSRQLLRGSKWKGADRDRRKLVKLDLTSGLKSSRFAAKPNGYL